MTPRLPEPAPMTDPNAASGDETPAVGAESGAPPALHARLPELGVAAVLVVLAVLVISDSLRVGIGWADDGPKAGYFPFYIGLMLGGAGIGIFATEWFGGAGRHQVFAEHQQLRQVVAVFLPTLVYVGLIAPLGIYLASALLIGWFMRRHGGYSVVPTLAVAIGTPLVFFLVFERWFLVPLPKGPIEQLLFGL
jgi:hypothetical protein